MKKLTVLLLLSTAAACGDSPTDEGPKVIPTPPPPATVDTVFATDTVLVTDTLWLAPDSVVVPGEPVRLISRLWCYQAVEPRADLPDQPIKFKFCSPRDLWPHLPLRITP